jgi:hypothetical protein
MSYISLEEQLTLLESKFSEMSTALRVGDIDLVQASCSSFQQLAVDFIQIADEVGRFKVVSAPLSLRIRALAHGLPEIRSNLFRRQAMVEQALQVVVPASQKTTYAKIDGRFGSGFRSSGQLKSLSA